MYKLPPLYNFIPQKMYFKKTKKNKVDTCNICLNTRQMTWDHIPPSKCQLFDQIEIVSHFENMTNQVKRENIVYSNNGLKYRTICGQCNSLLGGSMDKHLIDLTNSVSHYLYIHHKELPKHIKVTVKPVLLVKALIGHLLAAKKVLDEITMDTDYRDFVLRNIELPKSINIFYWFYPFKETVVIRDFFMPATPGQFSDTAYFNLLKFYPFAFLFSDHDNYQGLPSLTKLIQSNSELEEADMIFNLHDIFHPSWPTIVDNNNLIFASRETQNSIIATSRKVKISPN